MTFHLRRAQALLALCALGFSTSAWAQIDARMFRYPDVSATHIAFVYAGDIWVVAKTGGLATRLSSPAGEEMFPRFSPDGATLAFSANYDGNTDVYLVPTLGGTPVRLTHHPLADQVVDWHPDGRRVLFASSRESGRQRYNQFYLVGAGGGLPDKLVVPYGEFGAFSPDGRLFAYMPQSQDFRTWKRYRGGWTSRMHVFDLTGLSATPLAPSDANDGHPMWHGETIYFLSDRASHQRANIWAVNRATGETRQITDFTDVDVTFPAIGPADIVFQAGGRLYLLDLATETTREVNVQVVTDQLTLKPRSEKVTALIASAGVSPAGKRAVFEARGEVFSVPAEHGPIVNLTRSSGVAERYPSWSPDGKTVAYWSDRSGEYELTLRSADGLGEERTITTLGPGHRYLPQWSPDGTRVAFIDEAMRVRLVEVASGTVTAVDQSPFFLSHGPLSAFRVTWSADSRYVAWSRPSETGNGAIFVYDTTQGRLTQATSGYFDEAQPAFDPEGRFLYFLSNRHFAPVYGDFDNSWTYPNATRIVAAALRPGVASPLAEKNDAEGGAERQAADEPKAKAAGEPETTPSAEKKADEAPAPVEIDFEGFEARVVVLPPAAGNYSGLRAVKGKILYRRLPRTGSGETKSALVYFDLEEREEKAVLDEADGFEASHDGKKVFVRSGTRYAIVDLKAAQKLEKPMRTGEMETLVDPRAEWRQMFTDAYRFERDYFYDADMHGVDWNAMRDRYGRLIDDAVTRWDVNFVLGEFIAELNASHTYRGGGDLEQAPTRPVGMLGVDWELSDGAYRIKRIVRGGPWDVDVRSPLDEPGIGVKAGDYVLAVNGVPLDVSKDPWAAFEGLADVPVQLAVNGRPSLEGSTVVVVRTMKDEVELRFREWIEARRQRVDEATGGRVGYVYVQSTGVDAQNELVRQFMAQWRKEGLVIDERFNSGGQIPDRFVELLNRPMLAHWAVRHGADWQWPPVAHRGPKVMLINGWSGSGGDAFPFYFREAKLGPLVGTRTWGGLIGISGAPSLVDGGTVTVPTFRMFDVRGEWFREGHGVEPDIEVHDDPGQLARGVDPQLERAIAEVMTSLRASPPVAPARPSPERRTAPPSQR